MFNLRVEIDVEFGFDGGDDAALEADDLLWVGVTGVVDDHQRLLVIDGCVAAALAFPAALLD